MTTLPAQDQRIVLPSPREWFGHEIGAERKLIRWSALLEYFGCLAKSPRLRYDTIGTDSMGQPLVLLTISSPTNLAARDDLAEIQQRLADPRFITNEHQRSQLLGQARSVCLVTCSIHGTEIGATQMCPELVYDLLTRDDDQVRRMLDQSLLLLVPSLNPGGLELVADWYQETLDTPSEGSSPPTLYHPYAGHDNNRDWIMQALPETRAMVEHVYKRWYPHVVVDLHQMSPYGPRYVLPPYVDPYDDNIDPILQTATHALGSEIAADLAMTGKGGVATSVIFDAFSPARSYAFYHGGVRILAEAASAKLATSIEIKPEQQASLWGFEPDRRMTNHPLPWRNSRWSLRDIVEYHKTTVLAALDHCARYRDRWVEMTHQVQRQALLLEEPFGVLIPAFDHQRDPGTAADLLEVLRQSGVELTVADQPVNIGEVEYPTGTYLIRFAQPNGRWAKTLLEIQHYPARRLFPGGPFRLPYDVTAHALPLMMGVDAVRVDQPISEERYFHIVDRIERLQGGISGDHGDCYLLSDNANDAYRLINELLAFGATVERLAVSHVVEKRLWNAGTFLISDISRESLNQYVDTFDVQVNAVMRPPELRTVTLRSARIGLYRSWVPNNTDEAWTRYVFDAYRFPFSTLRDADFHRENDDLAHYYDVIILPAQIADDIVLGNSNAEYPAQYAGGLGEQGLEQLNTFVGQGGVLIAIDTAGEVARRACDLPVADVMQTIKPELFTCPGALLRLGLDTRHSTAWGFERETAVMFANSPAYAVDERSGENIKIVGRYPTRDPLLSGWMHGGERLANRAGIVEVVKGQGKVLLIGFRPFFRTQTRATYRLLFNNLYVHLDADDKFMLGKDNYVV